MHRGKFSPASLQQMLRDESDGYLSIWRRPDPSLSPEICVETVASVVMGLGQRVMHIAPDVPRRSIICRCRWVRLCRRRAALAAASDHSLIVIFDR